MGTKITKNKLIQTNKHDKIQSRMVQKNIHTNQQILPFQPTMPQLRISKKRPHTRHQTMEMPCMRTNTSQRHKRSNKYSARSNKIMILKINKKKYIIINSEPVSQREIA